MTTATPTRGPSAAEKATEQLDAARHLHDEIAARAAEIEANGTMPVDLVDRMWRRRLFALGLPRGLGGLDAPLPTIVEVVEELSHADTSAGWVTLIANTSALFAWLDSGEAGRIVHETPDPVLAGSMAPMGRGEVVQDGTAYRVTGRWPFASGCRHANWFIGAFVVYEGDNPRRTESGAPEMRVAYFPASEGRIVDTWKVAGLQGTGSDDIEASGVTVPVTRTAVPYFEPARVPGRLARLSPYNVLMTLFAGLPLGVARRSIEELTALAKTKRRAGAATPLIEDPAVGGAIVEAEFTVAGLREQVLETFTRVDEVLAVAGELSERQRAELAGISMRAMHVGRDVVSSMFHAAGASELLSDSPIQRCFRDLSAASQHLAFGVDFRTRIARRYFGLETRPALFDL